MPTCIAYTEDGAICRQPVTRLDVQRGGMVCDAHARHDKPELIEPATLARRRGGIAA